MTADEIQGDVFQHFNISQMIVAREQRKHLDCGRAAIGFVLGHAPRPGGGYKKVPKMMPQGWQTLTADTAAPANARCNGLALLTGSVSNLFVVDVDDPQAWRDFLSANGREEPRTVCQKSASQGYHLLFSYDERLDQIPNSQKSMPGTDIRTNGGCIYAVPTRHEFMPDATGSGESAAGVVEPVVWEYRWERSIFEHDPIPVPGWIVSYLLESSSSASRRGASASTRPGTALQRRHTDVRSLDRKKTELPPNLRRPIERFITAKYHIQCDQIGKMMVKHSPASIMERREDFMEVDIELATRFCPFQDRTHSSNHQHITMAKRFGSRQWCFDADCRNKKHRQVEYSNWPEEVRNVFRIVGESLSDVDRPARHNSLGATVTTAETPFKSALKHVLIESRRDSPTMKKLKMAVDESSSNPSVCNRVIALLENTYCPICKIEPDDPHNYVEVSTSGHIMLKCQRNPEFIYPNPPPILPGVQLSAIMHQNNLTINIINNGVDDNPVALTDLFPDKEHIVEDDETNNLLYICLIKNTHNVLGKLFYHMAKNRVGITTPSGKGDNWVAYNDDTGRWVEGSFMVEIFCNDHMLPIFETALRYYNENTVDSRQATMRSKHIGQIIKSLANVTKSNVLHEASLLFKKNDPSFADRLDANRDLLAFNNGVYDFAQRQFRPLGPEDYVTFTTGYDFPETRDEAKLNEFLSWLEQCQPETSQREYILMLLAAALDGHNREEMFHYFLGVGRNGKGMLEMIMAEAFGDYATEVKAELFTRQRPDPDTPCPELMALRGKRWVSASESGSGAKLNAPFMKLLTGNDTITGRVLYSNEKISFRPQHSIIIQTNSIPQMDSEDNALYGRARQVDWPITFNDNPTGPNERQIDRTLKAKCPGWAPVVMHHLCHLHSSQYVNLRTGLLPTPEVEANIRALREKNDPYLQFIQDRLEITGNPGDKMFQRDLYAMLKTHFQDNMCGHCKTSKLSAHLNRLLGVERSMKIRVADLSMLGWRGVREKDDAAI
jgi:P4 family phage/plasmid primase-like protien